MAVSVMSLPCFTFALGAKVRYVPYSGTGASSASVHAGEPCRVIGRSLTQMQGLGDVVSYYLQPWILTGQWMAHDRPLHVMADQVEVWKDQT